MVYGVSASAGIGEKGETGDGVTVQIRLTQVVKKGKGRMSCEGHWPRREGSFFYTLFLQ